MRILFDRLSSKNGWNMVKPGDFSSQGSKRFSEGLSPHALNNSFAVSSEKDSAFLVMWRKWQNAKDCGRIMKSFLSWRIFLMFFPTVIIFQSNFWILEISKSILQKKSSPQVQQRNVGVLLQCLHPTTATGKTLPKIFRDETEHHVDSLPNLIHLISYLDDPSEWFRTLQWSSWYILYHTRRWHISSNEPSGKPTWATRCACGSSKPLKLRSISRSSPVLRSENRKICLKPIRPMFGQHVYI